MNAASKNMDFLTKHWAPYRRKYPALFPLVSSDYLPAKAQWMRTRFATCNFSMILRGEGRFERAGVIWPVQAPCVITQWPGEQVAYGPTGGTWAEWYLVYDRSQFKRFRERGLVDISKPAWPVAQATGFEDEFYFSRRFRIEVGHSPRDYRKTYRLRR